MRTRSLFVALFCALLAPSLSAQTDNSRKFDPILRHIRQPGVPASRMRALSMTHAIDTATNFVHVMVNVDAVTHASDLFAADPRITVGVESNHIITARIPIDALDKVAGISGVRKIMLGHKYKPVNDIARSSTTSGGLFLGTLSTAGVAALSISTGAGVVIGDVDTGADFRHPDFINGTRGTLGASSRLIGYWDQTLTGSGPSGVTFQTLSGEANTGSAICGNGSKTGPCGGYGVEWNQTTMNTDVRTSACVSTSAVTFCSVKSVDTGGHGTAVLGCAGGNGNGTNGASGYPAGTYAGMAPGADLVMVQTNFSDPAICDGVAYIFARAAAKGEPAVANLSLGGHVGPHDGTSWLEQCLDGLTSNGTAAGKIIVAAAGNEGYWTMHEGATITGTNSLGMNMTYDTVAQNGAGSFDLWHDGNDAYDLTITASGLSGSVTITSGNSTPQLGSALGSATIFADNDPSNTPGLTNDSGTGTGGSKEIIVFFNDSGSRTYTFTLTRKSNSTGSGRVDAWVGNPDWTDYFTDLIADNAQSVGMPATDSHILAAGAYTSKMTWQDTTNTTQTNPFGPGPNGCCNAALGAIAPFSSVGPTRDGRTKPELAAPGNLIVTTLSQNAPTDGSGDFAPTDVNRDGYHAEISGTSFASPFTSGAVALRLQQNKTLTQTMIIASMTAVARADANATGLPNNTWGSGKLMATPPAYPAPTGLAATALSASSIRWSFNSVALAEGYRLRTSTGGFVASVAAPTTQIDETGLGVNSSYTRIVEAYNLAGSSTGVTLSRYTQAAVPATPSVVSTSSGSVTLTFGLSSGNPANTAYELSASTDSFATNFSTPFAFAAISTTTVVSATGLTAYTTYSFRLRARNQDGVATGFSTLTSTVTNPGPPPAVTVSAVALGYSSISWTWNLALGATNYNLFQSTDNASLGSTTNLSLIRQGLDINTRYGLIVVPSNTIGQGPSSSPSLLYTLAVVPGAPSVNAVTASSIWFGWTSGGNPGGTTYLPQASADGFATAAGSATTQSSETVSGLSPDTNYTLRVAAQNGDGVATGYSTVATTPTWAAVPGALALTQTSSASLHASWSANGNPTDTVYELSLSSDGFATSISTPVAFTAGLSADAAGLLDSTTYSVRVRARNRVGITTSFAQGTLFLTPSLVQTVTPGNPASLVFGGAQLTVPAAAFSGNVTLTLQQPFSFPAPTSRAGPMAGTSSGIDILTDAGQQPLSDLTLTLPYSTLPSGATASELVIARFDGTSEWIPLPSTVDPSAKTVTARLNHLSLYQVMALTPASSLSAAAVLVYPNPVYTSRGQSMKFSGLPASAEVRIYTFRGDFVRSVTASGGGLAVWDGTNSSGSKAASGVYLALIKSGSDTKTVKIMVER